MTMVDLLIKLYPDQVTEKNNLLNKIRFYSLIRFILRHFANGILPVYFEVANWFRRRTLPSPSPADDDETIIVSLTSFPRRIKRIHLVVETILRQTLLPDRMILWLSEEQFPGGMDMLPAKLLDLTKRGLEIKFCPGDLRSHKKYYYTLSQFPRANMITIDDDIFYPSYMISLLAEKHRQYPRAVCFIRGYEGLMKGGKMLPYDRWKMIKGGTGLRKDVFPTSGGGALYPPRIFHRDVTEKEIFSEYCPYADDVWLFCMTVLHDGNFVKADNDDLMLPVLYRNNEKLTAKNVGEKENDRQLLAVRNHYLVTEGIDLFEKLTPAGDQCRT